MPVTKYVVSNRIAAFVLLAVVAGLFAPSKTFAWGCEGHQVVALIAERELSPTALNNVNALLRQFPADPGLFRYCAASFPAVSPMSDAATWPDDVRSSRHNGDWHFVDVPVSDLGKDPKGFCGPNGCVISAIEEQLAILRKPGPNSAEKADALRYVIHFVGDVHQPLHAATDNDMGGNCDPLAFDKAPQLKNGAYKPELHGIWDTELVAELAKRQHLSDSEAFAQELDREISPEQRKDWGASGPDDWAKESTRFAVSAAYSGLTKSDGTAVTVADFANTASAPTNCDLNREQSLVAEGIVANPDYRKAAEIVIEERLKRAGVRLAKVLNDTWAETN